MSEEDKKQEQVPENYFIIFSILFIRIVKELYKVLTHPLRKNVRSQLRYFCIFYVQRLKRNQKQSQSQKQQAP